MAIKIFNFICNLLIPLSMVAFGYVFAKHPPEKINMAYGYRTNRSMKNQETWNFAHEYSGKIWRNAGSIMLVITLIISVAGLFMEDSSFGVFCIVLICLQLVVLIGSIYPVEKALKEKFDENGNRRGENI